MSNKPKDVAGCGWPGQRGRQKRAMRRLLYTTLSCALGTAQAFAQNGVGRRLLDMDAVADHVGGALFDFWPLGMVAVLAVQVREQEHQWKRQRPDNRSNPCPNFEAASSTLGNSTGKIDRNDKTDHHQREGNIGAHSASSDAAVR